MGPSHTPQHSSHGPRRRDPVICIAEDRASCEPALRLLLASLTRICGDIQVELFCPNATAEFRDWLQRFPSVSLHDERIAGAWKKYDVKPQALLTLLDRGYQNILWLDADMMICRDFRDRLRDLRADELVVTEEALCSTHQDPEGLRARLWGLRVGRTLPFTVNSCVLRVTGAHRSLLQRWLELLADHRYRAAQEIYWRKRPPHLLGDQDVLTALLASDEFAHVPIRFLRRGTDILQCFGSYSYTVRERVENLWSGLPPFVHSQGNKPWWSEHRQQGSGSYFRFNALYLELSPYMLHARRYRHELADDSWLAPSSMTVSALRGLGVNYPPLTGLPLAIVADVVRLAKGVGRRTAGERPGIVPGAAPLEQSGKFR